MHRPQSAEPHSLIYCNATTLSHQWSVLYLEIKNTCHLYALTDCNYLHADFKDISYSTRIVDSSSFRTITVRG